MQEPKQVIVITGASRGIGRAIAQTLATAETALMLVARDAQSLEALASSLRGQVRVMAIDLSAPDAAARVIDATLEAFGHLDVLINNAGAAVRGDFLQLSESDWQGGFALKFFGTMRLCRSAWPHLVARRGVIVNIAGIGGRTANADFCIGGAVNAALLNLSKALAHRGNSDGVRVHAVNPATILTDRLRLRIAKIATEQRITEAQAAERTAAELGIARFGRPEEVASAVAFLVSPQASYCQGVVLDVDGGQTRTL